MSPLDMNVEEKSGDQYQIDLEINIAIDFDACMTSYSFASSYRDAITAQRSSMLMHMLDSNANSCRKATYAL